jgi:hypothetical protein
MSRLITCDECGLEIGGSASFCKHCGASLSAGCPGPGPASAPSDNAGECCERCGARVDAHARFCKECGASVPPAPLPAVRRGRLPPRTVGSAREGRASSYGLAPLSRGTLLALIGSAVALAGCFLPLGSSGGQTASIFPDVSRETAAVLIFPLSCVAIALLALGTRRAAAGQRATLSGAVIAIASYYAPNAVFAVLGLLGVFPWPALSDAHVTIGAGTIALASGFTASLVGGFMLLRDAVRTAAQRPRAMESE